jgi:hypothetical protein
MQEDAVVWVVADIRARQEILEQGFTRHPLRVDVRVWPCDETQPYVQLEKYNTTLGGQPRRYARCPRQSPKLPALVR